MQRENLLSLFPEIDHIKDKELRNKCINVWLEVLESGGWWEKGIDNCPLAYGLVSVECPENSLSHCRRVVRLCVSVLPEILAMENDTIFESDLFIAGAVLHDVGKFLEYDYRGQCNCYSETAHYYKHVVSGAYIAKKHGLPDKVVHMVLCHSDMQSPEGPRAYLTPELLVLKYIEHMAYSFASRNYKI